MANTPATGLNWSTTQAKAGETMPEKSRKLEYTADISVRSEGFTAIMNGRPAHTSKATKHRAPIKRQAMVNHGEDESSAASTNQPEPQRNAALSDRRSEWR